jgi:hypothetical protein
MRARGWFGVPVLLLGVGCHGEPVVSNPPAAIPDPVPSVVCPDWLTVESSMPLAWLEHASGPGYESAVDAGGRWLAVDLAEGALAIYRLSDGREVAFEPEPSMRSEARLDWAWTDAPGRLVLSISGPSGPPDPRLSVSQPHDTTLVELDVETGERTPLRLHPEAELTLHSNYPLQLGPAAAFVFGIQRDDEARLEWWDRQGGHGELGLSSRYSPVVQWSPDGEWVLDYSAFTSSEGYFAHWRGTQRKSVRLWGADRLAAIGREHVAVVRYDGGLELRGADDSFVTGVMVSPSAVVFDAVFDASEQLLAHAHEDRLQIHAVADGALLHARKLEFEIDHLVHIEPECGVLALDQAGRRRWLPLAEDEPERVVGREALWGAWTLLSGSSTGELSFMGRPLGSELSVVTWRADDELVQARLLPELVHSGNVRRTHAYAHADEPANATLITADSNHLLHAWPEDSGATLAWPTVDGVDELALEYHWAVDLPRQRLLAISRVMFGKQTGHGRMRLYDLRSDAELWTLDLGPSVSALSLDQDHLWLAKAKGERVTIEQRELAKPKKVRTLVPEQAAGRPIIALAHVGGRIHGLLRAIRSDPREILVTWTDGGKLIAATPLDRPSSLVVTELSMMSSFQFDSEGTWLSGSADGQQLIVRRPFAPDELWQVGAAPKQLMVAKQLMFADEPDHLLALVAHGRVEAWSLSDMRRLWTVQLYGDGTSDMRRE